MRPALVNSPHLIDELPIHPPLPLNSQLHRRAPPVLSVVMPLVPIRSCNPRPEQPLLLRQHRQQPKNNRHIAVQLQPHEAMRHGIRNVLEVHRLALDQHSNRNNSVEGLVAIPRRLTRHVELREVGGGAKEVSSGADEARGRGLDLGGRVELLDGVGELVAAGDALDNDVLLLHASLSEALLCAVEERRDHLGVPACVHDADAEVGAWAMSVGTWSMVSP
ncbi:hypothetical protein B5807_01715 [Epicoccum nigrum]|uniref:Uncharacterized protein n=1 Tax=Epicoccum nigrum TaxID=105696 RepID=A0A1Y2MG70_EPING|nr:hypothetical protein B5807_01715 [Epicoccum nigrum]